MFTSVPIDLEILVPINYPYDLFAGRAVTKILNAFHKHPKKCLTIYRRRCCCCCVSFAALIFLTATSVV